MFKKLTLIILAAFFVVPMTACTSLDTFAGGSTSVGNRTTNSSNSSRREVSGTTSQGYRAAIVEYGEEGQRADSTDGSTSDPDLSHISVELSFVQTSAQEFAKVFFAQLLRLPYTIDREVDGIVTLRTGKKVDGATALKLARQALGANGNSIVFNDGLFRVKRSANGNWGGSQASTLRLDHIQSAAAVSALQQFMNGRAEFIAIDDRTIGITGDDDSTAAAKNLISTIDVDQFKRSSFGLFPLKTANAKQVASELDGLYQNAGINSVYLLPIERMNALLVVSKNKSHLKFASKWLLRLDAENENLAQLNTYKVRHRDAEELSEIIAKIFESSAQVTEVDNMDSVQFNSGETSGVGIKITPDKRTNTILVWATKREFELINNALRRLDTKVDQVFVEATIAEVRLSNELSHGVKWFLESGVLSASLSDNSAGAIAESFPGFNFAMKVPHAKVVISALEDFTDVKIVSSPTLTVLDRETATIQVGDQVPIVTKSVQDGASGAAVVANEIQFKDTGIILKITPIIQPSGNVILNIEQEVSQVTKTTTSSINSPTISRRRVDSTVSVQSGTAIILGGLISTLDSDNQSGLPGTKKTFLQNIFGSREAKTSRTELLIFVRPVILGNQNDIDDIAAEIARNMPNVSALSGGN